MMSYDEDGLCVSVCEPRNPDIEEYMRQTIQLRKLYISNSIIT